MTIHNDADLAVTHNPHSREEISWWTLANCLGIDTNLFFPERGNPVAEAKQVCRGCMVRKDCLEYALTNAEVFGVWGGLSGQERRRLRRKQNTPPQRKT